VCLLEIRSPQRTSLCTGTLIRKDVILTAAHCLSDGSNGKDLSIRAHCDFRGGTRDSTHFAEHFGVRGVRTNLSHETAQSDFAFFRLDGAARTPPMALPVSPEKFREIFLEPSPYVAQDWMLKHSVECRFSGFGINWNPADPWYVTTDQSPANGLNGFVSGAYMRLDSWGNSVGRLRHGDSGGPLYCRPAGKPAWTIAAIVSSGTVNPGVEGRFTSWFATASSEFLTYWYQVQNEWK
jgi:secreted trypsin-like serine protease